MAYKESYAGRINRKLNKKLHVVEVAAGRQKGSATNSAAAISPWPPA